MSVLTVWSSYNERLKATKPGQWSEVCCGDIIFNCKLTTGLARQGSAMFIDVIKMSIAGWLDLILMTVVLVIASHHTLQHSVTQHSSHSLPVKIK